MGMRVGWRLCSGVGSRLRANERKRSRMARCPHLRIEIWGTRFLLRVGCGPPALQPLGCGAGEGGWGGLG